MPLVVVIIFVNFFVCGATVPSGPGPPQCRDITITFRHTKLGRTPLDEWSARRRDLYRTTHNTHTPCPCGIRTRNPSKQTAEDPLLRPRDQWDRELLIILYHIIRDKLPAVLVVCETKAERIFTNRSGECSCVTVLHVPDYMTKTRTQRNQIKVVWP